MKKNSSILAIALLASIAGRASADQNLEGSDTLEFVMRDLVQAYATPSVPDGDNHTAAEAGSLELVVLAGGSGTGEDALERDTGERSAAGTFQQIAHMSRALDSAACLLGAIQGPNPAPAVFDPDQAVVGIDKILSLGGNCDNGDPGEDVGGVDQDDRPNEECNPAMPAVVNGANTTAPGQCINSMCMPACAVDADCTHIFKQGSKGGADLKCLPGAGGNFCQRDTTLAAECALNTTIGDSGDGNPDAWGSNLRLLYFGLPDSYTLTDSGAPGIDYRDVGAANIPDPVVAAVAGIPAAYGSLCNSVDRRNLVDSCNLYHVYRRDDASGTTGVFKQLLGVPVNQPFCNAPNITTAPASAATPNDKYDADPIRVPCNQNEDVCACDGTLGLILPISIPAVSEATPLNVLYPTVPCGAGLDVETDASPIELDSSGVAITPNPSFNWDKNGNGTISNGGEQFCPYGHSRFFGGCVYPRASVANGSTAACMFTNKANPAAMNALLSTFLDLGDSGLATNRRCPKDGEANRNVPAELGPDERAFNLDIRVGASGQLLAANGAGAQDWVGHAFFRIHAWDGSDSLPAGGAPPAGDRGNLLNHGVGNNGNFLTTAPAVVKGCQETDATVQIGCLVARDAAHFKRSLGFAGLQALKLDVALGEDPRPDSSANPANYKFPVTEIANATTIDGVGYKAATVTDYHFTRKLYINSLIGFENVINNKYPQSIGVPGLVVDQSNVANHPRGDEKAFIDYVLTMNGATLGNFLTKNGYEATPAPASGAAVITGAAEGTEPGTWLRDATAPACGAGYPIP